MCRVVGVDFRDVCLEDAGCIVHWSSLQTCEGEYADVFGFASAHGLELRSPRAFVTDEVGVGAAEPGGAHGFVRINHEAVFGCFGHAIQIVVVHPLVVVVSAVGEYVSDVSALDDVVSVVVCELVGFLQLSFIVDNRR